MKRSCVCTNLIKKGRQVKGNTLKYCKSVKKGPLYNEKLFMYVALPDDKQYKVY